jgi:pimeloyl-ACP methyl ester carboxylesterase
MLPNTIDVDGQSIAYISSAGTGPAIVLIHGNSASHAAFLRQIESPLGQRYRVVALDLPGHGASANASDPPNTYTLPGYARILASFSAHLGLETAVFVGWSLGGHIVLEASDLLPKAAGLVIFGTPPLAYPPDMAAAFFPHPAMGAVFQETLNDNDASAFVTAFFKPGTSEIPARFLADARRTDGQARVQLGASIMPGNYRDEVAIVANLTTPLAILHGEHEQLANAAYMQTLTMPSLWRKAIQIIPDAGHAPQWEQPERFNALLDEFVQACHS